MPRLAELSTLCKVIEQKSFSRAAELLGLSQPAISLQVKSLEGEYGVKLLHRDGFEIVPTESGQAVYEIASQIVHLYERSKQRICELNGQASGTLLVGASTGPGEYLIPVLLSQFKERHPSIDASLRIGDSSNIIEEVLRHDLELGFVGTARRDRHLCFEPFVEDQLVLVVQPAHPWADRSSVSCEELFQVPLVLQQSGSGATTALFDALDRYGISIRQLNIVMHLGLQESTKAAVRSGLAATIISRLGVTEELTRKALVEVPITGLDLKREFYIVYRRTSPLSNVAKSFLDFAGGAADETIRKMQNGLPSSDHT